MKINKEKNVNEVEVQTEGAENVTMKILIGPEDGSNNIIMRYFKVLSNGHTPRHKHPHEHIVKIEKGKGIVIDGEGNEHEIASGESIFVESNEEHQFKNPFPEPVEFICNILNPEKYE